MIFFKLRAYYLILTSVFIISNKCISQKILKKELYFYEDSTYFSECGTISSASILIFVKDTSNLTLKSNYYYLVKVCPTNNGFYKKGLKYQVQISKNYMEIFKYFHKKEISDFIKHKRFYFIEKITPSQN